MPARLSPSTPRPPKNTAADPAPACSDSSRNCAIVFAETTGSARSNARSSRCMAPTRPAAPSDVRATTDVRRPIGLRERAEEQVGRRIDEIAAEIARPRVAGHADDLASTGRRPSSSRKRRPTRVRRPEVAARHALVDDRDARRVRAIARVDGTAEQQRNLQRLEEPGRRPDAGGIRVLLGPFADPLDDESASPTGAHRSRARRASPTARPESPRRAAASCSNDVRLAAGVVAGIARVGLEHRHAVHGKARPAGPGRRLIICSASAGPASSNTDTATWNTTSAFFSVNQRSSAMRERRRRRAASTADRPAWT